MVIAHSGAEARAHAYSGQWGVMDGPFSLGFDYDPQGNLIHRYGWGGEVQGGGAGQTSDLYYTYTGNRRNGFQYDAAGNVTWDGGQTLAYDAEGRQVSASYGGYSLTQAYDGDRLRVKKVENGAATYYLRSSVLGGQVVAELNGSGTWTRGYVYGGSGLLAVQQSASVSFVHEDPMTKSRRITNSTGSLVSAIELDPFGADTNRSSNAAFQPKRFTSYERDGNGSDEAMHRRYNRWHSRFDQPDPADFSYDLTDPQSLNRYAYTQNDPVNFVDPSGLNMEDPEGRSRPVPPGPGGIFSPGIRIISGWTQIISPASEEGDISVIYPPHFFTLISFIGAGGGSGGTGGGDVGGGEQAFEGRRPRRPALPQIDWKCHVGGSGDIGGGANAGIGAVGGIQIDQRGVYGYSGVSYSYRLPNAGGQIMAGPGAVSPGLNLQISGGAVVGMSRSVSVSESEFRSLRGLANIARRFVREGTFQYGGTTPGGQISLIRVSREPIAFGRNCP